MRRLLFAPLAVVLHCAPAERPGPVPSPPEPPRAELPAAATPPLARVSRRIASGGQHACYATPTGRVECWGENRHGELGRGTTSWGEPRPAWVLGIDGATEIAAGNGSTCAIHGSGRVSCWGAIVRSSFARAVPDIANAISVAVDGPEACVVLAHGEVLCWRANANGADLPRRVPGLAATSAVRMSATQSCALLESGEASCWGRSADEITMPQTVAGLGKVIEIAVGDGLLARRRDDSVLFFGGQRRKPASLTRVIELDLGGQVALQGDRPCQLDARGRVGCKVQEGAPLGKLDRLRDPGLGPAIQLDSKSALSCALHAQGGVEAVSCWGTNEHGEIGLGDAIGVRATPIASAKGAMSVRAAHSGACALDNAGHVSCWGGDEAKQSPVEGAAKVERLLDSHDFTGMCAQPKDGDEVCWSLRPPRRAVAVPGLRGVIDQARHAGNSDVWVYAIAKDSLLAWRWNHDATKVEQRPIPVPSMSGLVRVVADSLAVCVQDKNGKAACATPVDPFEQNAKHVWLPVETGTKLREMTMGGGAKLCGLEESGVVSCHVDHTLPASGPIRLIPQRAFSPAARLARGYNLCTQGRDDVVRCAIGLDARGSGHGDQTNVSTELGMWKDVAGLFASSSLFCLWTTSGDVRCAGSNSDRQLGIEDPVWVADPSPVMLAP